MVNYTVDPSIVFHADRLASGAASALAGGLNVDGYQLGNELLLNKMCIERWSSPQEVVVLGSSRTMQITADMVGSRAFFNYSVSNAGVEDHIITYHWLRLRRLMPRVVVLGIDPWSLSGLENPRWAAHWRDYANASQQLGGYPLLAPWKGAREALGRYGELVSPSTFRLALRLLIDRVPVHPGTVTTTRLWDGPNQIKRVDGSLSYPRHIRDRSPDEVQRAAREFLRVSPFPEHYYDVNPHRVELWTRFLAQMKHDGVSVVLFETPISPIQFNTVKTGQDGRRQMSAFVERVQHVATSTGARLIGHVSPETMSLTDTDFIDGVHLRPRAMARALAGWEQ